MGLFDELLAGGDQHQSLQDFVGRYEQGAPHEGISDEEAAGRYGQVAGEVDPGTYRDSARDAFANMGPQDREQYAQQLGAAADQQGIDHGWDGQGTDPDSLAAMTSTVHQQSPGLLGSLLGGGGGGGLGGGLGGLLGGAGGGGGLGAGGGLGGLLGGGQGGGQAGGNPVMKAALAGIAAMAARRMMGGGSGGPGGGGLGGLLG